ncbi:MAG: hypothetical protein QM490_05190 [Candidatus Gracilibacteria bacterium]
MTQKIFKNELKFLEKFNTQENEKIEFIEKLYKLSNIMFNQYEKNGQNNIKE